MPPNNLENGSVHLITDSDTTDYDNKLEESSLITDPDNTEYDNKMEEESHHLEERELKFDLADIYETLKNLDWSKVVWRNVILFIILHVYAVYGIYLCLTGQTRWQTMIFTVILSWLSRLGITMGAHRLWSHKTYKAAKPVQFFLMLCQTLAFQNSIFEWSRDHRVHHKQTEQDGDPHDARRGFFFAHMGWLMYKKHPAVFEAGKKLDFSDLLNDPIVRFQKDNYLSMVATICFVMPTILPMYFWNEHWLTALFVAGFMRYTYVLHCTWTVNSLAHYIGSRPYDKSIYAAENIVVAYLALGEGWHNFHHSFPFDYRAAEFGGFTSKNITAMAIEFLSNFGLTYDLKKVSDSALEKRILRTGDKTAKRPK